MKVYFIFFVLMLPMHLVAQQSYTYALKLPIGANLTQRYGLQLEYVLNNRWSIDLEGRYLAQDWRMYGGEIFRRFADVQGGAFHGGVRYYLSQPEKQWRFSLATQYRFRYSNFEELDMIREQHEGNFMAGLQYRLFQGRLMLEMQIGMGYVSERGVQPNYVMTGTYAAPRVEFLIGTPIYFKKQE